MNIGWNCSDWVEVEDGFTPPIPLIDLKTKKWIEIKKIRDIKERSPLLYIDKLFDFDSLSSERLTWLISSARTAITLEIPFQVDWTTFDNSIVQLSATDIIGIPLAVAQRSNELHVKARGYSDRINSATTIEELESIAWEDI